jgi:hypothetical protein
VWKNTRKDRVIVVAAGVTFYSVLALFPAIAALVALYGLFADPSTINEATGQLYWDGGQVRTRNMLRLGTPERWIAFFAALGAFGTFAVNAARFVMENLL